MSRVHSTSAPSAGKAPARGTARRLALAALGWTLALLPSALAAPVRHLVLDLDETLLRTEQRFETRGGRLEPLLREIPDPAGGRPLYLAPGAERFAEFLAGRGEGAPESLEIRSARRTPAQVAAILKSIPAGRGTLADVVSPSAAAGETLRIGVARSLPLHDERRRGDRAAKASEPAVELVHAHPDAHTWKRARAYAAQPIGPLANLLADERELAALDAERSQLRALERLLVDASRTAEPNRYAAWNQVLQAPLTIALERAHFKYLIPDLLAADAAETDILVLGRDGRSFYDALVAMRERLGIRSRLFYLDISRPVSQADSAELRGLLAKAGLDPARIRAGERRLRIVDTGFRGTVPRRLISAIADLPANAPAAEWRERVRPVTAFLMSAPPSGPTDPARYDSVERYFKDGGFIETPTHQERFGAGRFRGHILHFEHQRPQRIERPHQIVDGAIATVAKGADEVRYAEAVSEAVREYFGRPDVQDAIHQRTSFMRGKPGDYPAYWSAAEPTLPAERRPPVLRRARGLVVEAAAQREVRKVERAERSIPMARSSMNRFAKLADCGTRFRRFRQSMSRIVFPPQ